MISFIGKIMKIPISTKVTVLGNVDMVVLKGNVLKLTTGKKSFSRVRQNFDLYPSIGDTTGRVLY